MPEYVCRKSKFSLDDSPSWEGYTYGQTWNGFACPYFEKDVAHQILSYCVYQDNTFASNGDPKFRWSYEYDPKTDRFLFFDPNYADDNGVIDPYEVEGEDITYNGKKIHVYGVGNFAWVWSEDEPEDQLICDYCNSIIEDNANYLEARPLRKGGATAVFCGSDCAGAYFAERMCDCKTNTRG